MIDVTEVLNDPDFCSSFVVERTTGEWDGGRFKLHEPVKIPMFHPVQPANTDDLEQIPEGDRVAGLMKFFCVKPKSFQLTHSDEDWQNSDGGGISDVILFGGKKYKLIQVTPWDMNGWQRAFGRPIGMEVQHG